MITSKQRRYLKGLAHELEPMVMIGKEDLTDNIINELDVNLEKRELVKVKIQDGSALKPKETANELAEKLGADFVQAIGKKFVIYRKSVEEPKIELPKA
ncbi:MAG: ribosome assembly RNA-binding protein YhbY [Clostridiales bacterium]|jgi:RNA-binding protein|nr:ribosome assembly RNA-binding protein YhbY [Clostridiales bacterium]